MPFNNPIVAGEVLIRAAIESENFASAAEGAGVGWTIRRDGTAEFSSISVRGAVDGTAGSFDTLSITTDLFYQGNSLQSLLDDKPKGIVAWGQHTQAPTATGGEQPIIEISFTSEVDRIYRFGTTPISALGGSVAPRVWWTTDGSQPVPAAGTATLIGASISNIGTTSDISFIFITPTALPYRLLVASLNLVGGAQASFPTGIIGFQCWIEDMGPSIPQTGINRIGSVTPKQRFSFDILPIDARSYQGDGSLFNIADRCYQGQSPFTPNGNMRSYLWFDKSTLDGLIGVPLADIESLDVFLHYEHWYNSSGGDAIIGRNNNPNITNNEVALGNYDELRVNFPARNIGQWINVKGVADFTSALFSGNMHGLILGPAPTTSFFYYGYTRALFSGAGIRAVYYK